MATAVLTAILKAAADQPGGPVKGVLASVRTPRSQERLKSTLAQYPEIVEIVVGDNVRVAEEANIVILGHKPYMLDNILGAEGMTKALSGKLIISILGGVSTDQIHEKLSGQSFVLLANPNMAARVQESMTMVAEPSLEIPSELVQQAIWLFSQAGRVSFVSNSLFNLATVMGGACIALTTIAVDGILDAAVIEGMTRSQAQEIVAQCLLGTGKLLASGTHPAVLRESISSPRGCTIRAIAQLESRNVRSAFTESVRVANDHIKHMGSYQEPRK